MRGLPEIGLRSETDGHSSNVKSDDQALHMSNSEATKLITTAAKAVLRPIGCLQKGRSRVWLDDQYWWVGVVEFQPSGWSMGSYLNVGACWLWYEKDYVSFDAGNRVSDFHSFRDIGQFSASAASLAEQAKSEVIALRQRFRSPMDVTKSLSNRRPGSIWDQYHSGVSAGLAGEIDIARRSFDEVMSNPDNQSWCDEIRQVTAKLMRHLDTKDAFKAEVSSIIVRTRASLKLPDRDVVL